MLIKNARFIISSTKHSGCPEGELPEYAFIGRSNVGKSSLINMITGVKDLAKTSSKPGKTVLINHFLVNEKWYIVDLPGYGYAKVSHSAKESIYKMITDYVIKRKQLACLFVLIDIRHEPQQIDLDFIDFLGESEVPFAIIFTKSDKINQNQIIKNINNYKNEMSKNWEETPTMFLTSSINKKGRQEILDYIESINNAAYDIKESD
jgi:GTP-binding protein